MRIILVLHIVLVLAISSAENLDLLDPKLENFDRLRALKGTKGSMGPRDLGLSQPTGMYLLA